MRLDQVRSDWTALGSADPLWAVLVSPDGRNRRWSPEDFLATGREEIAGVLAHIEAIGLHPQRARALDLGCGAGRLTHALAAQFEHVVGVDISPTMLETARSLVTDERCEFIENTEPHLHRFADDSFDLAVSSLVLQHLPPDVADQLLSELVRVARPGGVVVVQVAESPDRSARGLLTRVLPRPAMRWAQQRVLGYPAPMDMWATPFTTVARVAAAGGARIADAVADPMYGGHWRYRRYYLTVAGEPAAPADPAARARRRRAGATASATTTRRFQHRPEAALAAAPAHPEVDDAPRSTGARRAARLAPCASRTAGVGGRARARGDPDRRARRAGLPRHVLHRRLRVHRPGGAVRAVPALPVPPVQQPRHARVVRVGVADARNWRRCPTRPWPPSTCCCSCCSRCSSTGCCAICSVPAPAILVPYARVPVHPGDAAGVRLVGGRAEPAAAAARHDHRAALPARLPAHRPAQSRRAGRGRGGGRVGVLGEDAARRAAPRRRHGAVLPDRRTRAARPARRGPASCGVARPPRRRRALHGLVPDRGPLAGQLPTGRPRGRVPGRHLVPRGPAARPAGRTLVVAADRLGRRTRRYLRGGVVDLLRGCGAVRAPPRSAPAAGRCLGWLIVLCYALANFVLLAGQPGHLRRRGHRRRVPLHHRRRRRGGHRWGARAHPLAGRAVGRGRSGPPGETLERTGRRRPGAERARRHRPGARPCRGAAWPAPR